MLITRQTLLPLCDGSNRRLHLEALRPVGSTSKTEESSSYHFGSLVDLENHPLACMPEILLDFELHDEQFPEPEIMIMDLSHIMIRGVLLQDLGDPQEEDWGVPTLYILDWQKGTIQAVGHRPYVVFNVPLTEKLRRLTPSNSMRDHMQSGNLRLSWS